MIQSFGFNIPGTPKVEYTILNFFFYQYLIFIAAICEGGCGPFATCVKPGRCKCKKGYVGKKCRKKVKHECLRYCMKSCPSGNCTCPKYGKSCEKGKYCFQK